MAFFSEVKLKHFPFLLLSLAFIQCANQLPPEGGAVDLIPPEIIEVYPADGTINFDDEYFEIGFSEYVDKRSVKEAIFISPAIDGEPELDWSGKYVRVYFPEKLKQNLTYVVTIGTDVEDYNNRNKMSAAFTFTFSTGNEIDRRAITGKIFDEKPQGIMLFAYRINDSIPNPGVRKPDYISQSSAGGLYKLAGLAAGNYRIFAVRDEFRDLKFQPEQDQIGIPYQDVHLEIRDSLFSGLDFMMTKIDTLKPRLLNAFMTDKDHLLINFSEELEWTKMKSRYFYLIDSTLNRKLGIKYAFKGNTKPTEMVLVPSDTAELESSIYLFADTIIDKSNNVFQNDFTQITVSDKADTSSPELYKTIPNSGSKDVDYLNSTFAFNFSDAIDLIKAREGIVFSDTSNHKIPFQINFIDDASFFIQPLIRLEMSKDYIIKIDLSKFKDKAGNSFDNVYKYTLKTISGLEFTGVSGRVKNYSAENNMKLKLKNVENTNRNYSAVPSDGGQFSFERIIPGKYLLLGYFDTDSSNSYTQGNLYPYRESEKFSFYPDTLNLRARWSVTDLQFNFKER